MSSWTSSSARQVLRDRQKTVIDSNVDVGECADLATKVEVHHVALISGDAKLASWHVDLYCYLTAGFVGLLLLQHLA